jgi:hypothetical protein
MPIRPENKARYPKDWKQIVARIRERSSNRCEFVIDGVRCPAIHGENHPITGAIVILTVAHLNHCPEDCSDENLLHACQRCHNRYDAPIRRKGIAARAKSARACGDLLESS